VVVAWQQVWLVGATVVLGLGIAALYFEILLRQRWSNDWASVIELSLPIAGYIVAVVLTHFVQRFRIQRQAERATAASLSLLVHIYTAFRQGREDVVRTMMLARDELRNGDDGKALSSVASQTNGMIQSLLEFREQRRTLAGRLDGFLNLSRIVTGDPVFRSSIAILVFVYTTMQVFSLVLNVLQYSRTPEPYRYSKLFSELDRVVVGNLYMLTTSALAIAGFVLITLIVSVLLMRFFAGSATAAMRRYRNDLETLVTGDDEIIQELTELLEEQAKSSLHFARQLQQVYEQHRA